MFKVKVNDTHTYRIENNGINTLVNDQIAEFDLQVVGNKKFHIIKNNISYQAEVNSFNPGEKSGTIKINANTYQVTVKDQYDDLLQKLGIDILHTRKVSELRAPMPGLVLKILIEEGQDVKKGDNMLILEAMKMENIIKAHSDATILSLKIKPGAKVEKNQLLITFK